MLCRCEFDSCARAFDCVQDPMCLAFITCTSLFSELAGLGNRLLVAVEDWEFYAQAQTEDRAPLTCLSPDGWPKDKIRVLPDHLKMQLAFSDLVLSANTEQAWVLVHNQLMQILGARNLCRKLGQCLLGQHSQSRCTDGHKLRHIGRSIDSVQSSSKHATAFPSMLELK